jgi:beta-glucosidase
VSIFKLASSLPLLCFNHPQEKPMQQSQTTEELKHQSFMSRTSAKKSRPMTPGSASFPKDFWWGAATAAYQIEGAANEDGRKPSIWDTFSHIPGMTANGETGDIANDHYHRYEEDVKLIADLGVKHYRFSISWSRIIPDGRGAVNPKGVDFYKRLADCLLRHGITPHATLYHWDLPQALQDLYRGWESREIVQDFGAYAEVVASNLGDRITHWITMNEIANFACAVGYGVNRQPAHAPGVSLATVKERSNVTLNALLAHGTAVQALRAASPKKCYISAAENIKSYVPVCETPEHIEAARQAFLRNAANGSIITPMLTGGYSAQWLEDVGSEAPDLQDGDMELIAQPLDAIGINCYTGTYVRAANNTQGFEIVPCFDSYPKGNMPWLNIIPESIYWGIRLLTDALGRNDLPVFISENGLADSAAPDDQGYVADLDRLMYCRQYLRNVHRALAEGYPVVGYFPWSLMDNFEWQCGYAKRFGMVGVDFETQKRTPKLSFEWYQQVIRNGRIM